jgi:hypothetical protein
MQQAHTQRALNDPTARVFLWGFRISAALLLVGLIVAAIRGESLPESLESVPDLLDEVAEGRGRAIAGLGILVMLVTPIVGTLSVVLSCFSIGDRRYGMITLAVLAILILSALVAVF